MLTEEMFWLPAELASQETLKSIKKHQTPSSSSEIQHSIDRRRSGEAKLFLEKNDFPKDDSGGNYDPHHFIEADLMYKVCFCRNFLCNIIGVRVCIYKYIKVIIASIKLLC